MCEMVCVGVCVCESGLGHLGMMRFSLTQLPCSIPHVHMHVFIFNNFWGPWQHPSNFKHPKSILTLSLSGEFPYLSILWGHLVLIRLEKDFPLTHTDSLMNVSPFHPFCLCPAISISSHSSLSASFSSLPLLLLCFLSPPSSPSLHLPPQGAHYVTKRTSECYLCRQAISPRL